MNNKLFASLTIAVLLAVPAVLAQERGGSDRGGDRGGSSMGWSGRSGMMGSGDRSSGSSSMSGSGRSGMMGGPMGGGSGMMGGPMGGGSEMSDRIVQVLRTMDANGDGVLTLNEIPEQRRPFATMMLQRMGRDPNQPVNLNSLASPSGGSSPFFPGSPAAGGSSSFGGSGDGRNRSTAPPALVQPFGEKTVSTTASTSVVPFGQAVPTASIAAGGGARVATSNLSPVERNARELMEKYDRNRNGYLDKDKQEWNRALPFDANRSDKNRDGRLSMAEILSALGGTATATSGAMVAPFRVSEPYDHLPAGVPDWFIQRDRDRDCQLTMVEYANGQPWNDGIVTEFEFLDLNADGVATITECFAVLQRIDREKEQKADAEQRARERLQGGVAALPPPPDPNATTPPADGSQSAPPQGDPAVAAATGTALATPQPAIPTSSGGPPTAMVTISTPPAPPQPSASAPYAGGSESRRSSSFSSSSSSDRRQTESRDPRDSRDYRSRSPR